MAGLFATRLWNVAIQGKGAMPVLSWPAHSRVGSHVYRA